MKKIILGKTGIEVTELCFGALPIGPTQKNLDTNESASVMAQALRSGITFFDTAQMYKTYDPIRLAMKQTGIRPVISTKAAAENYEDMDCAVQEALMALDVDYIDIFLLHAARVGDDVFEKRAGALQCLIDYKKKGVIKAVGISTHAVGVVELAAINDEIDIVFPIINKTGMGILRGTLSDMENAINKCFEKNKGVFLMKALAGGNLINDYLSALDYVKNFSAGRASVAMGMVSVSELEMNVKYFNGDDITELLPKSEAKLKEFIALKGICVKCGKCVEVCHSGAITLPENQTAVINNAVCLKCGYCVASCKAFAIRMV